MSASEIIRPQPDTSFVETAVEGMNPLGVGVVRAVYLAQHFGQGDAKLTDTLAEQVSVEVGFWLPHEKKQYRSVRRDVRDFFTSDGALLLASASLAGIEGENVPLVQDVREDFINRSWQICHSLMPTYDALMDMKPFHTYMISNSEPLDHKQTAKETAKELANNSDRKALYGKMWQHVRQFKTDTLDLEHFIEVDRRALAEGYRPNMVGKVTESMVRESVLGGYPTGSRMLNGRFKALQEVAISGAARPQLRALRKAWGVEHPGENFFSPEYEEAKSSWPRLELAALRTLRRLSRHAPPLGPLRPND